MLIYDICFSLKSLILTSPLALLMAKLDLGSQFISIFATWWAGTEKAFQLDSVNSFTGERPSSWTFITTAPITEIAFTPNRIWGYKWNPKATIFNKISDSPHFQVMFLPAPCTRLSPPAKTHSVVGKKQEGNEAGLSWEVWWGDGDGRHPRAHAPHPQGSSHFFNLDKNGCLKFALKH